MRNRKDDICDSFAIRLFQTASFKGVVFHELPGEIPWWSLDTGVSKEEKSNAEKLDECDVEQDF